MLLIFDFDLSLKLNYFLCKLTSNFLERKFINSMLPPFIGSLTYKLTYINKFGTIHSYRMKRINYFVGKASIV